MRIRNAPDIPCRIAGIAILTLLLSVAPLKAQEHPAAADTTALDAELSQRYHAQVVLDPALGIMDKSFVLGKEVTLEAALDRLTGSNSHAAWRRLYLSENAGQPVPAKLARLTRTLDRIGLTGLVLEDTTAPRATLFLKNEPIGSSFDATLKAGHFHTRPLYLIYSTTATEDDNTPEERFADLQRQQIVLLDSVPDQIAPAMRQSMFWWMGLETGTRQSLMERMAQAGAQTWQTIAPEQRQAMMQQFLQKMLQQRPPVGNDPGAGEESAGARRSRNYREELERITTQLARRYHVRFTVDPAIFLTVPPQAPAADQELLAAVTRLAAPLKGVVWRRVYQRPSSQSPPRPQELAETARLLDQLEVGSVLLENPRTKRATTYRKNVPVTSAFPETLTAARFRPQPLYLFYALLPPDEGSPSPEERCAALLRRQMEMMLSLNPRQIAQIMEQGAQLWQGLDSAGRERMMGLPMVAGMMAAWFPIKAKEKQEP